MDSKLPPPRLTPTFLSLIITLGCYLKGRRCRFWSESENLEYPWSIHNPQKYSPVVWKTTNTANFGETPNTTHSVETKKYDSPENYNFNSITWPIWLKCSGKVPLDYINDRKKFSLVFSSEKTWRNQPKQEKLIFTDHKHVIYHISCLHHAGQVNFDTCLRTILLFYLDWWIFCIKF